MSVKMGFCVAKTEWDGIKRKKSEKEVDRNTMGKPTTLDHISIAMTGKNGPKKSGEG